jgi:CRP/FNR family transcriptional regulator, cyclic AMP receptor protein
MDFPGLRPKRLPLASFEFLECVHERDLARLEQLVPATTWPARRPAPVPLAEPGYLCLVREGRLALLGTTPSGHPIMIALLEPGAIWSTLGNTPAPRVFAFEPTVVSAIPASVLEKLMARYPPVGMGVAAALSDRAALLREIVLVVGELRVEDRLRARLVELGKRLGVATSRGVRLELGLTHAEWGLLVGASRESVTSAFGRLRAEGVVWTDRRTITIDWSAFEETEPADPPLPEPVLDPLG